METLRTIETSVVEVFNPSHIPVYLSTAGGQFGTGYLGACGIDMICHWLLGFGLTSIFWRFAVMCIGLLLNTITILVGVGLYGPDAILHLIPFQMGLTVGQPVFMSTCINLAKDLKADIFSKIFDVSVPPVMEDNE